MEYKFSFIYDGLHHNSFKCEAKNLNEALEQFAIYIYKGNYNVSSLGYYYYVSNNSCVSKRIFSLKLRERFSNFISIISAMDIHYGIDKQEIL